MEVSWPIKMLYQVLYPALQNLPERDWKSALHVARRNSFDMFEKVWLVAATTFVAFLLRLDALEMALLSLPVLYLSQFVVAVPFIILTTFPAYLRCTRRGLKRIVESREGTDEFTYLGGE